MTDLPNRNEPGKQPRTGRPRTYGTDLPTLRFARQKPGASFYSSDNTRSTPGRGAPGKRTGAPAQGNRRPSPRNAGGSTMRTGGSSLSPHARTERPRRTVGSRPAFPAAQGTNHFQRTRKTIEDIRDHRSESTARRATIPPLAEGDVRIIILGGVEEIGRNMLAVEYGNDIVVIDCGFQFKDEETPGVDYILANTEYLEERKDRVRAVMITHGHLDHTGGLPYILPRIGNPPVYTRKLTGLMIEKRHSEFPHLPALDLRIVETDDKIMAGDLPVRFFKVTHTIPDAMGIMVETPYGVIVHTGDLKLDHRGGVPTEEELREYEKFDKENVLLMMADSTNVQKPGFSIPEPTVHVTVEELIKSSPGRVIVATFSSLLERIIKVIEFADTHGKKVVVDGRSMKTNIELAQKAGLFKYKKGTVVGIEEMENYAPNKIVMLVTGAQGDEFAVLMRVAMKKHKHIKLRDGDTVLFSSSVVPGNERAVQKLKDLLSRQGAKIVHYETSDVHSSGHAYQEEARWIIARIHPKFFVPLHGYHYMLRTHTEIATTAGVAPGNSLIADDGSIIEIREKGTKIVKLDVSAPNEMVMVDGFSIGNVQEAVMRDRQMLAEDGIVVIVATIDMASGHLMKSPDIVARGFVYVRESQELLNQARLIVKKTVEDSCGKGMRGVNFEFVKEDVRDRVGKYLFQKTNKQPMVIPVLLGI